MIIPIPPCFRVAVLRITFETCDFLFSFILYPAVNLKTISHPACQNGICIFIANSATKNSVIPHPTPIFNSRLSCFYPQSVYPLKVSIITSNERRFFHQFYQLIKHHFLVVTETNSFIKSSCSKPDCKLWGYMIWLTRLLDWHFCGLRFWAIFK